METESPSHPPEPEKGDRTSSPFHTPGPSPNPQLVGNRTASLRRQVVLAHLGSDHAAEIESTREFGEEAGEVLLWEPILQRRRQEEGLIETTSSKSLHSLDWMLRQQPLPRPSASCAILFPTASLRPRNPPKTPARNPPAQSGKSIERILNTDPSRRHKTVISSPCLK